MDYYLGWIILPVVTQSININRFFHFSDIFPDHLLFILHETPGARYSLVPGDFISKGFKVEKLKFGSMKQIGISKSIRYLKVQKKHGICKEYDENDSQERCYIKEVLAKQYENFNETLESCVEDGKSIQEKCSIPQSKNILDFVTNGSLWQQCTTKDEYHCMLETLVTDAEERNAKCPNPCTEITYETITKSIPHDVTKFAIVQMYYNTNFVTVHEEYLIFDFSAILVAIGGSLGLFLGFSFFQCGNLVMEMCQRIGNFLSDKILNRS